MKSIFLTFVLVIFLIKKCDSSFGMVTIECNYTCGPSNNLADFYPKNETNTYTNVFVSGKVNTLSKDSLKDAYGLMWLDMTNVGLKEIAPGTFKNLSDFESAYLGENHLNVILNGTFSDLPYGYYINLSSNQISVLEAGAFTNLHVLNFLHLKNNKISKVQRGVFDHISVRILDLSDNVITELEEGFLETVVSHRGLNMFLALDNNKIERLDKKALSHSNITHLYLANNSISTLKPGDLSNLPKLQYLSLTGNKLTHIQNGIFNNPILANLDLSHNQIDSIATTAFDNMPKLKILKMSNNKIKTWDKFWFQNSPSVSAILLRNNLIEELPEDAFQNNENTFFYVDLSKNRIKTINPFAFYDIKERKRYLKYLILKNNQIDEWDKSLLNERKRFTVYGLDLRGNKLKCFGDKFEGIFDNVEVVWLEGNLFEGKCFKDVQNYTAQHQNYKPPDNSLIIHYEFEL